MEQEFNQDNNQQEGYNETMEKFKNVPFGNSVFQIQHFTDGKETPERRYRHCLLQLHQKQNILKECEYRRRRIDIDIAELKFDIDKLSGTCFERQRLDIDLEEKEYRLGTEIKLIEDCLIEVAAYEAILKTLPEFTRQEFEGAEQIYWERRLLGDASRDLLSMGAVSSGVLSSLENIGIVKVGKNAQGQIIYNKVEEIDDCLRINETNSDKE